VGTTKRFDSEWEELGARGLKLEKVLVFVEFAVEGVGGCLKGLQLRRLVLLAKMLKIDK
jgi:hypothetical protein